MDFIGLNNLQGRLAAGENDDFGINYSSSFDFDSR